MHPPLLSLVFFLAVCHASPTSMDELPSSISDILEDRNLIPTNFKMVNFSSQDQDSLILKFDVVKALWENDKNPDYYVFTDSYYRGTRFHKNIYLSNEIVADAPHFDPSLKIVHIKQSENDNSTHSEYATQMYHFLSSSAVKMKRGDDFHIFQGTILENWHNLEIMKHTSLRLGKLIYCPGDNSIYLKVSLLHREIVTSAILVDVHPLGHFEANRSVFVESFIISEILFVDRGDDFDVLFDPDCSHAKMTCLYSDDYYTWCEYIRWTKRWREMTGEMRRLFLICIPKDEDAEIPFGKITTTSLTETRVVKSQLSYIVETAEDEFFVRFPNRTSVLFEAPESGVFLLRCPEGTAFWFANDTVVSKFVCEDETIDDIEIVDLRPERHWIREDPIGNWTEDKATSFTKIPANSLPATGTEGEGGMGLVIAMVCFIAVALVAGVGGVWKWRNGMEQNEKGGNDVERMEHEDTSNRNSNSEHTWNNVNFVEE